MIDIIGNKSLLEGRPWSRLPIMTQETKSALKGSADFLALNYYTSRLVGPRKASSELSFDDDLGVDYFVDEKWTRGQSEWLYNVPEGLYDLLKSIKDKYDNPTIIITENGFSDSGQLDDTARLQYLKGHIASVSRAANEGCNITGYTVWSIIDNFEWISGFSEKFGIFAVDMKSEKKERIKKSSATFFQNLIKNKSFVF
jgi:beta-glucosidase/6-phospho-beta-glucosidase/beta-galactosidase